MSSLRDNFTKQSMTRAVENHLIKPPLKEKSNDNQSTRAKDIEQPKSKKMKIMDFLDDEDEDYLSSLSTNNRRNVTRQVDE